MSHWHADIEGTTLWEALSRLVACDTATGSSTLPAFELLAELLDRPGWSVVVDHPAHGEPGVVAWAGPPEPGGLALSGHVDVVPWRGQPGWTREPLHLVREGGRAYGRGVADMKGAIAQLTALAATIDPARLRRPVLLVLTADEEIGCLGAERLMPRLDELTGGLPRPAGAVIGEPTGGVVYRAHKGHVTLTVTTHGRGGHSSRPDLGANAIAAMAAAAGALAQVQAELATRVGADALELFPDYPAVPFNLGLIAGGTADNMIAERCTLTIGFRPGPGDGPEELAAELGRRMAAAARAAVPGTELSVDEVIVTPGMTSPATGPVADALRELTGQERFLGAPFATDGGHFERAGVPAYIWGPGELAQAHQPNESVTVEALQTGLETLAALVGRICR